MWEFDPNSEASDPVDEQELAKLTEELRIMKLRGLTDIGYKPVKRIFGFHVPWAGSDCDTCWFRGIPRYPENRGRCMIFESPMFHKYRKDLPSPCVTTNCPFFVSGEEVVIRASDHQHKRILLDNLRAKIMYIRNGGKHVFTDPRDEKRYMDSVKRQKRTRSFLSSIETVGWWNNMSMELRRLVIHHIYGFFGKRVSRKDWGYLPDKDRRLLVKWKHEFSHTVFKKFIKEIEDKEVK